MLCRKEAAGADRFAWSNSMISEAAGLCMGRRNMQFWRLGTVLVCKNDERAWKKGHTREGIKGFTVGGRILASEKKTI